MYTHTQTHAHTHTHTHVHIRTCIYDIEEGGQGSRGVSNSSGEHNQEENRLVACASNSKGEDKRQRVVQRRTHSESCNAAHTRESVVQRRRQARERLAMPHTFDSAPCQTPWQPRAGPPPGRHQHSPVEGGPCRTPFSGAFVFVTPFLARRAAIYGHDTTCYGHDTTCYTHDDTGSALEAITCSALDATSG
jgi:hypothetical protein